MAFSLFGICPKSLNVCSSRNILVPQIWTFANESLHQRNTLRIIKNNHINTVIAQQFDIAWKVLLFANDHSLDSKLEHGAQAHHARTQRRIKRNAVIARAPTSLPKAVHLSVGGWIAVLNATVMTNSDNCAVLYHDGANRESALIV